MDYYKGKNNKKTKQAQNEYRLGCLAEKRVALYVFEKGSANSIVYWDGDTVYPYKQAEDAVFDELTSIIDKYRSKSSHGGIGVHHGSYVTSNKNAEPLAKALRAFFDKNVKTLEQSRKSRNVLE